MMAALLSSEDDCFNKKVKEYSLLDDVMVKEVEALRNVIRAPRSSNEYQARINELQKQLQDFVSDCKKDKEVLESNFADFQNRTSDVEGNLEEVKEALHGMDEDIAAMLLHQDKTEAWLRRQILLLNGIEEWDGENTNQIALDTFRAMGVNIAAHEICRSHRNGPRIKGKHRPIFVKFVRHDVRDEIYFKKNALRKIRGYRYIYIDENLTKYRSWLFREARKEKLWNVWTYDGSIFARKKDADPASKAAKITNKTQFIRVFGREI